MKSIIHILPHYYKSSDFSFNSMSSVGGAERYVCELARELSITHDVTLLSFGEKNYDFFHENLKIKIIKKRPFLRIINGNSDFLCFRLFSILKNFDIIHAHQYYNDTTLIAVITASLFRIRIYVTDHGWRGLNLARYFPAKLFVNKLLGQTYYDQKRFKVNYSKFGVIYGGVDLEKYNFNSVKTNDVIFIGRLLPHKGIEYLIDAIPDNIICRILGHSNDASYLENLKVRAQKNKNIVFLLSQPDEVVRKYLSNAMCLVLPSVDRDIYGLKHNTPELFGLVVAEAFACGTPVIVSSSSALPYVVDDKINGFIVNQNNSYEIKNKISYLISNRTVSLRLSANARNKAEKLYNWKHVADCCAKYYSEEIKPRL